MLGVSLLLEGFSLLVAIRTVTAGAASQGLSFAEFVRRGMDPTSIAVMMEDGAACAGLVIAGTCQRLLPRPFFRVCSCPCWRLNCALLQLSLHILQTQALMHSNCVFCGSARQEPWQAVLTDICTL